MRQYSLVTQWHLDAPIDRVWKALLEPDQWPRWWRYVEAVVELAKGDAQGVGAIRRYTWSSRLPYRLSLDMRTTALARPSFIEGVASGDLNGSGRWQLQAAGQTTLVRYIWIVTTGKSWMNLFAPILAPVFAWNHDQVMREGGRGLAQYLGVPLLAFEASSSAGARTARYLNIQ
ncbi:MAG: SRPBCC family protein [Burkholderiaceae bacterium]